MSGSNGNGKGDASGGEFIEEDVAMTREQYLLYTSAQSPMARVTTLLHMESHLDAQAQRGELETMDFAAAVQVKLGLIGLQMQAPDLVKAAIMEIHKELGHEQADAIQISGSMPKVDLTKVHAALPERTFTECGTPLPFDGIQLAPGLAQVTCKRCILAVRGKVGQ